VCTTDPAFGRGAAIAVASGFAVARAVDACDGDADAVAAHFDTWFGENVVPWHADSVAQDRGRTTAWQQAVAGASPAAPSPGSPALMVAAAVAGADPALWRGFVRYAGMLDPPSSLQSAAAAGRMTALVTSGWTPTTPEAPSHAEMAELVGG
jgi:hypothetical protein